MMLSAYTIRSRIVLEMASHIVGGDDPDLRIAEVHVGEGEPLRLSAASTSAGMLQVAERKLDLAIANPSAALMLARTGRQPFGRPLPLATIAVIPSPDQYVFAVRREFGLATFEDIADKRPALDVLLRGAPDHFLHYVLDDIAAAAGFSMRDLATWGGSARKVGTVPYPDGPKFAALRSGEANAIFDEAADRWVNEAIDLGLSILPLAEATVRKLEAIGYRRAVLDRKRFPKLPADVLTIDFSGWPIFVHAELPDARVTQICAALEARKAAMPWQEDGPLPLATMCRDTPEGPVSAPFHPAAEKFWRERGYLT
ncbi:MAG: hypothetical protein QOI12_3812 [Alphaproteobacteria bacterium]|jgi:hypothetical protein|nr:hypothetical protein [Alphaproteobacteria bacterium]